MVSDEKTISPNENLKYTKEKGTKMMLKEPSTNKPPILNDKEMTMMQ